MVIVVIWLITDGGGPPLWLYAMQLIDNSDEEARVYSGLTWEDVDDGIDGLDALVVPPPWTWFGEDKHLDYYDWGLEQNIKYFENLEKEKGGNKDA